MSMTVQGAGAPAAQADAATQPNQAAFNQKAQNAKLLNDIAVQNTEMMGTLILSMAQQKMKEAMAENE